MEKLLLGKIVNTFGLKGDLKILPYADKTKFGGIKTIFIDGFDGQFAVEKVNTGGKNITIKLKGLDDINLVSKFINHNIQIEKENFLQKNEYLINDIIGSKIIFNNNQIATVMSVENYGASDILVIDLSGKEKRVPLVLDYFENIDIKNKVFVASKIFFEGVVWR